MTDMNSGNEQTDYRRDHGPQRQCRKCGATIPKYSENCPQCGVNLRPVYKRAWFWILIVVVVLMIVLGGCVNSCSKALDRSVNSVSTADGSAESSSGLTATSDTTAATAQKYTVKDEQLVDKGYGLYTITGTFTNTSGKEIGYVSLKYVVKDSTGAQTGTAYANTTSLADQTSWKFEAYVSSSGDGAPSSFELKDVTGF